MSETEMLYDCPRTGSAGQVVIHPTPEAYVDAVRAALDDGYTMCVDLTAVDYSAHPGRALPEGIEPGRFEVIVMLLDMGLGGAEGSRTGPRRLRVRVQVPGASPEVPSLFDVHPGTEAMEREAYDMYGITFTGHPDLTRILMPEDWEGYPLRKDYATGEIPVQFKGTGVR